MKKTLAVLTLLVSLCTLSASAEVIGVVDFDKVIDNYTKYKSAAEEMSDKYSEIQRYGLDKEREYKKITSPIERKNFEENTAKEISKKQEAYFKLKQRRETEINNAILNTVKQIAIADKIDTVVDKSVVFFGGIDITDKVVKALNTSK